MELPAYHWPTVSNVLRSMWERGWSFIKKAGTIILMSTIVLWFLMNFGWVDGSFGMLEAEQLNDSILASIGNVIAPLFAPLGWGDWKMAVAAVSGLIAKRERCWYLWYPVRLWRSCRRRCRDLGTARRKLIYGSKLIPSWYSTFCAHRASQQWVQSNVR